MKPSTHSWVGADPGGKGRFGIAILNSNGEVRVTCVDCADEAVETVRMQIEAEPMGVGVDAPMWWSSGVSGDRLADRWLRKTYKLSGGQVQAANSLRGAALVQGTMFVDRLRQHFPDVPVTEAHPKALLMALGCENWQDFQQRFGVDEVTQDEHHRDALVAAVAAREGFEQRWPLDLSQDRLSAEQNPQEYWLSPVHYFWPSL